MKKIKTRSPEEYRKAFELFALSGKEIGYDSMSVESFILEYPYEDKDVVGLADDDRVTAWSLCVFNTITFDDKEEIKNLTMELLEMGLPQKKTPVNDKIYKKMVEDHKDLERQISALKNQEYTLWKDILRYENENFGSNHSI